MANRNRCTLNRKESLALWLVFGLAVTLGDVCWRQVLQAQSALQIELDADQVSIPELIGALQGSSAVASRAECALRTRGRDALPAILAALHNPNAQIRAGAARVLCKGPEGSEEAIPLLIKGLSDSSVNVRAWCASALGMRPGRPELVIPALMKAADDRAAGVRLVSRLGLGEFHSLAEGAVDTLCRGLQDPNALAREAAVEGLRQVGQHPEVTVPALIPFLSDPSQRTRTRAVVALMSFAKTNDAAFSALQAASQSTNSVPRSEATRALNRLRDGAIEEPQHLIGERTRGSFRCGTLAEAHVESDPLVSLKRLLLSIE